MVNNILNKQENVFVLKIGAEVEVLSPKYLRDEIKNILENTLKKYL